MRKLTLFVALLLFFSGLTLAYANAASIEYSYDNNKRLTTQTIVDGQQTYQIHYEYDPNGNLTRVYRTQHSTTFVKGINFNGGAVTIEGNTWLAESAAGVTLSAVNRITSNKIFPSVDQDTSDMLNTVIFNASNFSISQSIANGQYEIYLWSREDYLDNFRSFHVELEGNQVTTSPIGAMLDGQWQKHGPFEVNVTDGVLDLTLVKVTGDPMLLGMAIYSANADVEAPSAPTNVTIDDITSTSVTLSWSASTDNVGVTGYEIVQGQQVIKTTSQTSATITNLTPDSSYTFHIRAKDAADNQSALSTPVTFQTLASSTFVKGINFNGGAVTIEGNTWLAESAAGLTLSTVNRIVTSNTFPSVDQDTSDMLNAAVYNASNISVSQSITNGQYEIYLWSRENYLDNFRSFHIELEGNQVTTSPIGAMLDGQWQKHGPYEVNVTDGVLDLTLVKVTGDPMLVGMAIHEVPGNNMTYRETTSAFKSVASLFSKFRIVKQMKSIGKRFRVMTPTAFALVERPLRMSERG